MSVVDVVEDANGRDSTFTGPFAGDLRREFVAKTDSRTDDMYVVYADSRIPKHGTSHPRNILASLQSLDFKTLGPYLWHVTCNYSTKPQPASQANPEPVPWFRLAVVTGGFQSIAQEPSEDAYGRDYQNSAGQPFSEAPRIDFDFPTFQVRKNVIGMPGWFYGLRNLRNDGIFVVRNEIAVLLFAAPLTLRYRPLGFSEVKIEGSFRYYELSYELIYDENAWQFRPRDRGRFYMPARATRAQRVVPFDEGGEQNLDGHGGPLPKGAKPKTRLFRPYGDGDFSSLPMI